MGKPKGETPAGIKPGASTSRFLALDKWIRMRVRCMKLKRKSCHDNYKLRMVYFEKLGLLNLSDFAREAMCKHAA